MMVEDRLALTDERMDRVLPALPALTEEAAACLLAGEPAPGVARGRGVGALDVAVLDDRARDTAGDAVLAQLGAHEALNLGEAVADTDLAVLHRLTHRGPREAEVPGECFLAGRGVLAKRALDETH